MATALRPASIEGSLLGRRRFRRAQLEGEVANCQFFQQVLRLGWVEQIGGDGGVELE
jgi:hypothetical protein